MEQQDQRTQYGIVHRLKMNKIRKHIQLTLSLVFNVVVRNAGSDGLVAQNARDGDINLLKMK
jgi:hypothetical protein